MKEVAGMGGGSMSGMISLVLIFLVFWFLIIRPQQQQAKKRAEMLTSLKVGDKIVTIGGICGIVNQITDDKIFIEIADGIVIEMLRNSISSVETEEDLKDPFADDDEELDADEDDDIYYDDEEESTDEAEQKAEK
ncbi:MAG: preprotein translocase subunit YajC [Peptococcaceae bacterium]